jgi:hypothetical protein
MVSATVFSKVRLGVATCAKTAAAPMGWKASVADRAALLGKACTKGKKMSPDGSTVYIFDGNATFRNYAAMTSTIPQTAEFVARLVLKSVPEPVSRTFVCVLFDDGAKMPQPQRSECYAERYNKRTTPSEAAVAEAGKAALPGCQPFRFTLLFETPEGKRLAYAQLARATMLELCRSYKKKGLTGFAVSFPDGKCVAMGDDIPSGLSPNVSGWGEADQKCYEAAVCFALDGWTPIVVTVDTDMILQVVARWRPGGPGRICLKKETVDVSRLVPIFDSADNRAAVRLSAAFFLIAAYGCDYSKPLSQFGYRKRAVAELATKLDANGPLPLEYHKTLPTMVVDGLHTRTFVMVTETTGITACAGKVLQQQRSGKWVMYRTSSTGACVRASIPKPHPGPDAEDVHLFAPLPFRRLMSRAMRTQKKAATPELRFTPSNVLREALRSAWAAVYFSGAGTGVENARCNAPYTLATPPPNILALLLKFKVPFVAYRRPPPTKSILAIRAY